MNNSIFIGNNLSPAIAEELRRVHPDQVIDASIEDFISGEPFVEAFAVANDKKDPAVYAANWAANIDKIKGKRIYVYQSTGNPVAKSCEALRIIADTLKYYGAKEVIAVMPFAAYGRQDRPFENRFVSMAPRVLAKSLKAVGVDGVLTLSQHSKDGMDIFRGVFGDKYQALSANRLLADDIARRFSSLEQLMIGAPDGADKPYDEGQARARELIQETFGCDDAGIEPHQFFISKTHVGVNDTELKDFRGDVAGKDCVIVDDMIDGGSTMINAAKKLKAEGARSVTCYATHGIFSPTDAGKNAEEAKKKIPALEKILSATCQDGAVAIDKLVVTNTVTDVHAKIATLNTQAPDLAARIEILSAGPALMRGVERYSAVQEEMQNPSLKSFVRHVRPDTISDLHIGGFTRQ